MHSPLFAAGLHGKQWMKLDLAKIERAHGVNLNALTSTQSSDPTQMLQTLENESDSLQNLGVATSLAERQLIMVAGSIATETTAATLAGDSELQRRYLGVEPLAH